MYIVHPCTVQFQECVCEYFEFNNVGHEANNVGGHKNSVGDYAYATYKHRWYFEVFRSSTVKTTNRRLRLDARYSRAHTYRVILFEGNFNLQILVMRAWTTVLKDAQCS